MLSVKISSSDHFLCEINKGLLVEPESFVCPSLLTGHVGEGRVGAGLLTWAAPEGAVEGSTVLSLYQTTIQKWRSGI